MLFFLTYREGKKAIADAAIDGGDAKAVSRLSQKGEYIRVVGSYIA